MDMNSLTDQIIGVTMWSIAGSLLITVLITVLIIGVIVWAIRRSAPASEDPAITELKGRMARGEIDPTEFRVRIAELEKHD